MSAFSLATRIQERLDALGMSARAASLRATGSDNTIRHILNGRSGNPRVDTLAKIAAVLETTPEWLLQGDPSSSPKPVAEHLRGEVAPAAVPYPYPSNLPNDLPVLGTAAGALIHDEDLGKEFEGFHLEATVIQYVRRPPALQHVKEAYSLFVEGDSMYPMHPPGELRFVHPLRSAAPGDSVIVQTRTWQDDPGQAYIKIYKRRSGGQLHLEQLNPPCTISIPLEFVVSMHRVLTMNELFGI